MLLATGQVALGAWLCPALGLLVGVCLAWSDSGAIGPEPMKPKRRHPVAKKSWAGEGAATRSATIICRSEEQLVGHGLVLGGSALLAVIERQQRHFGSVHEFICAAGSNL